MEIRFKVKDKDLAKILKEKAEAEGFILGTGKINVSGFVRHWVFVNFKE